MKKIVFLLSLVILFSCKKADDDLIIKAGFACGWGAGEDSLVITQSEIKYVYYIPQRSPLPVVDTIRSISRSEWEEIQDAVNISAFRKLDYNSCNICVDGCDEWITLQSEDINHQIRYGKGLKIESIAKLQGIIERIKAEFH
jgi:hypothetical protein